LATYYYSTQPFLAWCINHYFYQQTHWTYIGTPFYPYKLPNPRTSNPFRAYEDLYEPVHDRDEFSGHIAQKRTRLKDGIWANQALVSKQHSMSLERICDAIDIVFFYPVVYRVDIDIMDISRLIKAGSALVGSNEYLISDLKHGEFDLLFADLQTDADFANLLSGNLSQSQVLSILDARC
jgi:hypothetical protein